MKHKKSITILVICIIILSVIASLSGRFFSSGQGEYKFQSIYGEIVTIYGEGLYRYESTQQKLALGVQDTFTLVLAIPLLLLSLYLSLKGSLKGKLLLTGTIGYFLYSYMSYSFLRMYNPLFLIYVILMATSFFALILCILSYDLEKFSTYVNPKIPVKFIGGFQIFEAIGLLFLWIPFNLKFILDGTIPAHLEHYTTLGYDAIDLGIMVPTLIISAILIIKRRPFGYLLSSILIMQLLTMNTLISVLTIVQVSAGMEIPIVMIAMFPIFTLITLTCLIHILKNVKESTADKRKISYEV